ncbi:uncharacterized protein LOC143859214 [Tasmannia lanceolata]|uniref:uncharacterized protein LOC143859214 n=1 Tax=Tasmannia lanceolata TaxID=3420 RepID=UPI00406499EB
MAATNSIHLQLPKLMGKNYDNWSVQLKVFFRSQDLWNLVESGYTEVVDSTAFEELKKEEKDLLMETRKKDKKALYAIFQAVDESVFEKISAAKTAHAAWDLLQKSYKGDDRVKQVRLQTLRGEFESLKMSDSESISEFFDRVQSIVNQLKGNGEKIEDQRIVEKIMRSLTTKFDYVVATIEEGQDTSTMSIEPLMGSLYSHEQRMNQKAGSSNIEHALQSRFVQTNHGGYQGSRGQGRSLGKGRNNITGKYKAGDINNSGDRGGYTGAHDKSKVKCYDAERALQT